MMSSRSIPGGLWVAPSGYEKTNHLKHSVKNFKGPILYADLTSDNNCYFENLNRELRALNYPEIDPKAPLSWREKLDKPLIIIIYHWEKLTLYKEARDFWTTLLDGNGNNHLKLFIACTYWPDLPLNLFIASGGEVYTRYDLLWSKSTAQNYWKEQKLSWTDACDAFYEESGGWPVALKLKVRCLKKELSYETCQKIINETMQSWPITKDNEDLPKMVKAFYDAKGKSLPQYWIERSERKGTSPLEQKVYLERARNLNVEPALALHITTQLARLSALQGDWKTQDKALKEGEKYLESGENKDQAIWYYVKANALASRCLYKEAKEMLSKLAELQVSHPLILIYQTRSHLTRGLIYYQEGNYFASRESYLSALALAETDTDRELEIEAQVMLSFLDALTGENSVLPKNLEAQIVKLPLSTQPLLFLLTALVLLQKEALDLPRVDNLLKCAQELLTEFEWPALQPMVLDIKARLCRLSGDKAEALRHHQRAVQGLEKNSFPWLYAQTNHAKTLAHQDKMAAKALLRTVISQARKSGSLGVMREAQALLQPLNSYREKNRNIIQLRENIG